MSQLEQLEAHLSTGRQIFLTPTQFRFAEPVRAASLAKRVHNETTHTSPLYYGSDFSIQPRERKTITNRVFRFHGRLALPSKLSPGYS
ncbi:hypothetical protein CEXT_97611 [Caerostris extrusa]|uniref:Uncharacterized protein n=1 Tax=Caerostris extrusa TaxID=172846 RepID=A0AAV4XG83_CAEEX|nr:hypothetical protein CEXT_97611 [Caerostris extrusa]